MVCSKLKGCYILHKWMQKWDVHTFVLSSGVPSASGCSYSLCGFPLLSKYLFMLVRNSHRLVRIATGAGRQIFDNCSRFASWKRQRTKGANSLSRAGSKTKTKKISKRSWKRKKWKGKSCCCRAWQAWWFVFVVEVLLCKKMYCHISEKYCNL